MLLAPAQLPASGLSADSNSHASSDDPYELLEAIAAAFKPTSNLERRKGGGHGAASSKSSSGSSKSSSSSSSSGKSSSKSIPVKNKGTAVTYGGGGGKTSMIPNGQPFAGRVVGGGTRDQVYGSSVYGSGYPGYVGDGVENRGFPFYFWPVTWSSVPNPYYHDRYCPGYQNAQNEYGRPDNASRIGGVLVQAAFQSNASQGMQFRLLGDNDTISALVSLIRSNCSMINNSTSSSAPWPYFNSWPIPEQAIQYYRASSLVLTMDGYNDTSVFVATIESESTCRAANATSGGSATKVPSLAAMDQQFLECLNGTIGEAVPLIGGAVSSHLGSGPSAFLVVLLWFWIGFWCVKIKRIV